MIWIIIAAVALVIIGIFFGAGYLKAPPDTAYVISGVGKKPRILVGRAGFKIPFFERVDKLALGAIQIDVKTQSAVPTAEFINVRVDSNVNVRIGESDEMIALAAQNFLNIKRADINARIRDLLEGNIREIVGQMKLTDMVSDRKAFSEKVQENAVPDLKRFGLELISFNVQNFIDDNGVIDNLGIDNVEQIRKTAQIAKSNAEREIAIAQAENFKLANDAKVQAQEDAAIRTNAYEIKQAELKKSADTAAAQAAAAQNIEAANQQKIMNIAATDAEIARITRETELKQREIEIRERELDATVRKQADADRYAAEQKAAAELTIRQRKAEAERYEREQQAEADKFVATQQAEAERTVADAKKYAALAEAEGIAAKKKAEAEGIAAVGLAEAEGIDKKAEAQAKMGQASLVEMYMKALPQVVANAAAPLTNVKEMVVYGSDGGSKIVGDVMQSADQIIRALGESTGIDIKSVIAGYVGGKASQ